MRLEAARRAQALHHPRHELRRRYLWEHLPRDVDGLQSIADRRAGGGLFDPREDCNTRPPTHRWPENRRNLPCSTDEFEDSLFVAPD